MNDEEFPLLYNVNTSKNPDLPYWKHDRFDLDELSDDECNVEFCFLRNDIYSLIDAMSFPDFFKCYNGLKVDGVQSMCIF